MSEQPPSSDERREALQESRDYAGLQARLLTGEPRNFDPSADLSTLQPEDFPSSQRYTIVNAASTTERHAAWQGNPGNLEARKQQWAQSMVDFFTRQKQKENGTYYDTTGKKELEFLQRLGNGIGIAIDPRNFTTEAAMAIYGKYFGGNNQESAMGIFINDVLMAESALVDSSVAIQDKDALVLEHVKSDYAYIEMLGKIFGSKSGKVAVEYAVAVVKKSMDGGEKLVEQMRAQNPSAGEQELLQFLWEKGARALVEAQQNAAQQQANPDTTATPEQQSQAVEAILRRPVDGQRLDIANWLQAEIAPRYSQEFRDTFQPLVDRLTDTTSPDDQQLILQEIMRRAGTSTIGDLRERATAGVLSRIAEEQLQKMANREPARDIYGIVQDRNFDRATRQQLRPIIDQLGQSLPSDQRRALLVQARTIAQEMSLRNGGDDFALFSVHRRMGRDLVSAIDQEMGKLQQQEANPQLFFGGKLEGIITGSQFDGGKRDILLPLIAELKTGVPVARQQELMRQIRQIAHDMEQEFVRGAGAWPRGQVAYARRLMGMVDQEAIRLSREQANAQQERARDTGPLTPEQLREMIKVGAVDNYGPRGYEFWKDEVLHDKVLNVIFSQERNMDISSDVGVDSNVRMIGVPIRNFPPEVVGGIASGQRIEPTDVVLCFSFRALDVDNYHRNGMFRGLTIMSEANAKRFTNSAQQDPTLLFSLLREANGGYIRRQDGTPVAIDQGERIAILPNARLGGEVNDLTTSQPFPENYTPNPGQAAEQAQPQQPEVAQPEQQAGAEPQIDPLFIPMQQAIDMLRQLSSITDPAQQAAQYEEARNLLASANVWNENAMTVAQRQQREQLIEQVRAEVNAYKAAHPNVENAPAQATASEVQQPSFDSAKPLEDPGNTKWILGEVNKLDPANIQAGVRLPFNVVANSQVTANEVQARVDNFLSAQGLADRFKTFVDSYGTGGVTIRISPKPTS